MLPFFRSELYGWSLDLLHWGTEAYRKAIWLANDAGKQPVIPNDVSSFLCMFSLFHCSSLVESMRTAKSTQSPSIALQQLSQKKIHQKRPRTSYSWWASYPSITMPWTYGLTLLFTVQSVIEWRILMADPLMCDLNLSSSVNGHLMNWLKKGQNEASQRWGSERYYRKAVIKEQSQVEGRR